MISKRDIQIGKLALREGMLSKDQIKLGLAIVKKLHERRPDKRVSLGAVLLKKGLLTREQIEKIVELHNDATSERSRRERESEPRADESGEARRRKRRRKKKRKKAKSGARTDAPPPVPADSSSEVAAAPPREVPVPSESGIAVVGSRSEAEASLVESASEDASLGGEGARRVIACAECGKKYRVRRNQAGRRFPCRRCHSRVRVPKDLFLRAPRPGKQVTGVEVAEWNPTASSSGDLAAAVAAPPRVATAPRGSIADLARAALERKPDLYLVPPPSPRKVLLGWVQAIAIALAAVGATATVLSWKSIEAMVRARQVDADRRRDLEAWAAGVEKAGAALRSLVEDGKVPPEELEAKLAQALAALDAARGRKLEHAENAPLAKAHLEKLGLDAVVRDACLRRGALLEELGGTRALEAERLYETATVQDPKHAEAFARLGRVRLAQRALAEAVAALSQAVRLAPDDARSRGLCALAEEAGDLCREAARDYGALAPSEPLARVLAARALLLDGDHDRAVSAAEEAAKALLGGPEEAVAAAHVVRALALEARKDPAADAAFDAAVAAAPKSSLPLVVRGERRIRAGRPDAAAQDFEAAGQQGGGARALLGLGDACLARLDLDGARHAWTRAHAAAVERSSALVAGEVDPFRRPRAADPRAAARRRLGDLARASGESATARSQYASALDVDAGDAETLAALARLELDLGQPRIADERLKEAERLVAGLAGKGAAARGPVAARVLVARAAYLLARSEPAAAAQAAEAAAACDPVAAGPEAPSIRGKALEQKGDLASARDQLARSLALEVSADAPLGRLFAAAAAAARSASDGPTRARARVALALVLVQCPRHAGALLASAGLAESEGNLKATLELLGKAVAANTYFVDGWLARARVLSVVVPEEGRDLAKALEDLETALRIDARCAAAHLGRALVLEQRNEVGAAFAAASKAIECDGRLAEAYEARARLADALDEKATADADRKKVAELRGGK